MHVIKTWRDPYDMGWHTTRRKEIEFKPGVTILVGCNGIGKTTLLHNIKSQLKEEKIPYYYFDNLKESGSNRLGEMAWKGDYSMVANMLTASEGENISNNIGIMASKLRNFIISGDDGNKNPFDKIFNLDAEDEKITTNKRWILLDGVDSGYSIDNIIELKELFNLVLNDAQSMGYEVYIVASANEYELAANMNCLDVAEGTYRVFECYERFKKFIIQNRKRKDKRYENH